MRPGMQKYENHIVFENKILTLKQNFIKLPNNQPFPVLQIAFNVCLELLGKFELKQETYYRIEDFVELLREQIEQLNLIEGRDVEINWEVKPFVSLDSIIELRYENDTEIVSFLNIQDLLFVSKIFFTIDPSSETLKCEENVRRQINLKFEPPHARLCQELAKRSNTGIYQDIVQYYYILAILRLSTRDRNFSKYQLLYPFSAEQMFRDSSFTIQANLIEFIPPYNIWKEDQLIDGLLNQKYPSGVIFNQVEPQLNCRTLPPNQLVDSAIAAFYAQADIDEKSVVTTQYTQEELSDLHRQALQGQRKQRAIDAEEAVRAFKKLDALIARGVVEKCSYMETLLLFSRKQTYTLEPAERQKLAQMLTRAVNVTYEDAQKQCALFIKGLDKSATDGKSVKKSKELNRSKWINEHIQDDWYLAMKAKDK